MSVRALIVVLIILNAGVALWWALQPPPAPPAAPPQPPGVARLDLLPMVPTKATAAVSRPVVATAATPDASAVVASKTPAPAPMAATASVPEPVPTPAMAETAPRPVDAAAAANSASKAVDESTAVAKPVSVPTPPERCVSVGPYAARSDADAALARVGGQASRASVRADTDAGVSTFRVMLPNVGDRAAAQALVKRITAAGIGDYYVIAQGEDNTVALGQYQSRERAERRQASLVSAGFPAQLVPSGNGQSRWWIDVRSTVAAATLQSAAGATRQRSLDCSALR
ncbi:sporulation protein [Xanthomonas nasturtii]|uniref:SPOR domain-containing protein n=1 Tax=Xanthomonas nasturtii TaxID=1843581 RepID=A0ABT0LLQ5_9XANT|nr:SPOR domain-containing protein [Xanthomonas nasturtii]MCL1526604.1 SPOR domain-containing protein [Xanthomonas nasturtii]MCL1534168.1 SPOR domain-containing protein [Xanthomonas nasturtii]MCL1543875.1 SPOR domain-containing protein [Xanthomonas nasturtii]MCL1550270.1 SPOR domain-containing protein [Xanthomonas nasturtii]MCL1555305.1 SPOR domain-containing protein [Xanthomonas nasturtii]